MVKHIFRAEMWASHIMTTTTNNLTCAKRKTNTIRTVNWSCSNVK